MELEIRGSIDTIDTMALRSARILRRVQETQRDFLYFRERPQVKTAVKNLIRRKVIDDNTSLNENSN